MSIEALRKKRRMRRPRPRLTDGQKTAVLLALTFAEGWLVGFAGTHSRIPSPVGTPQWMKPARSHWRSYCRSCSWESC